MEAGPTTCEQLCVCVEGGRERERGERIGEEREEGGEGEERWRGQNAIVIVHHCEQNSMN